MSIIQLKGKTFDELKSYMESIGQPSFRGQQLFSWIYAKGETDIENMTDLGKDLREKLINEVSVSSLKLVETLSSPNKNTEKFLWELEDGNLIESVLMRYNEQKTGRCTVCISSQVGCAQKCAFCSSGYNGLIRNLTTGEIVDQVIRMQQNIKNNGEKIHNVVIMGIGEPLANYDNVLQSIRLLNDDRGPAIGMRRIAVSTVGIPPLIKKLADEKLDIRFAVSLHAPDNEIRDKIMPINKKYPIEELLKACKYYQDITGNRITFEYMLVDNLNDFSEHAQKLAKLLKGFHAMINLIPLNPVKHFEYKTPSMKRCENFSKILRYHGFNAPIRNERGTSIKAACGQLRLRDSDNNK
jgi:23S rRNA (adenine2503-C2)-methyltransferase